MADETDGVVTRRQILSDDFDHNDVQDGIERDLLVPIFRGTYAVSRRTLTPRMLDRAATLHFGPAMIVGRSAAERRDLLALRPGVVSVVSTRPRSSGSLRTKLPMEHDLQPGLVSYRPTESVAPAIIDGLPFAPITRMLTDIAAAEQAWVLERVWKQADYRGILDLDEVHRDLARSRRQGRPAVQALFDRHPGRFDVEGRRPTPTEVAFLELIIAAGLPRPAVNVPMRFVGFDYVADFFWEHLGLVAELDDPSHDRPLAVQNDAQRDAHFSDADLDVIRFDTRKVAIDPTGNMRRLASVIARHQRRVTQAALRIHRTG